MSQILKLTHENQQLKRQISQYKQVLGVSPFVDDSLFKGGYRVVKTIEDRDTIKCCWRKQGMKVVVIGENLSFKEYILKTDNCKENTWEEINVTVEENEVYLIEDYSELSENLTTQKELNLVLKQLILNLQTQIDNIELIDEKVQITEDTAFAQIGQTQKDFNKNVSDYKINADLKNQEQDDRMSNIEGENIAQDDLINDLSSEIAYENVRNDSQDTRLENLEGINYTWSPTNRTLTLYDNNGNQLSQVSLVSLDNEGTDIRYNASTLSLELYNADNELLDSIPVSSFIGSVGTQLQLNSNQLQLKDSQGNVLSTVNFTISNIQGLQTALDNKLDKGTYAGTAQDLKNSIDSKLNKPTTTSNTTSYPYVVGEDGNGNSARLPAGDLGKNFFNSDLNNTTARNHIMNAGVTINTLGNPHTLSGLPNKNADITNFRKVRVQNTSGLDSVVDSKNLALDIPNVLTDTEKTTWRTAMNGGWTTNTMSVAIITPPIVDKQDKNYWLSLKGANLNLNPANFSVQIMDSTGTNVIATVPNSQVQLYNNGIDLTFYYNFKDLPIGQYRIRLNNGVATMTTGATVTINVVQNLTTQDLSTTTWNVKTFNDYVSPVNVASGNSFGLSVDANIQALASNSTFIVSVLSSNVVPANTNFYMECSITISTAAGGSNTTGGNVYFGITGASSSNMLSLLPFLFYRGYNYGTWQSNNSFKSPVTEFFINSTTAPAYNSNAGFGFQTQQITNKIIIQRVQNNYTILFINTTTNIVRTLNLTGTTDALKLVAQLQNHAYDNKISGNIETIYLF